MRNVVSTPRPMITVWLSSRARLWPARGPRVKRSSTRMDSKAAPLGLVMVRRHRSPCSGRSQPTDTLRRDRTTPRGERPLPRASLTDTIGGVARRDLVAYAIISDIHSNREALTEVLKFVD